MGRTQNRRTTRVDLGVSMPNWPFFSYSCSIYRADGRCTLHTGLDEVHADVAEAAGKEARAEYLEKHPQMQQQQLKKAAKDVHVQQLVDRVGDRGRGGK